MKARNLIISASLFVSCSYVGHKTGQKSHKLKPHQKVEQLVNEGKLEEAREVALELKVPAYQGVKRIEASQRCQPVLDECGNESKLQTQQDVRRCLVMLKENCNQKYITKKHQEDYKQTLNSLNNKKSLISPIIKGQCNDGIRWGYIRDTDPKLSYKVYTDRIDYKNLHGQFEFKDKCEEARLLEPQDVQTSKRCYTRYIGERKTITIFEAVAMDNSSKRTLNFLDQDKCESALNNGFTYYPEENSTMVISAKGSDSPIRFIKGCGRKEVTICEAGKQGELFLDDLI